MTKTKTSEDYEFALQVFEREIKRPANINDPQDKATVAILAIGIRYGRSGDLLTRDDLNVLHDVLLDVTDLEYTDEQLYVVWANIPDDIKADATRWGMSDTVVRDNIYEWAEENIETQEINEP